MASLKLKTSVQKPFLNMCNFPQLNIDLNKVVTSNTGFIKMFCVIAEIKE